MSESMIERVAAAICGEASWPSSSDNQKEKFRTDARAAIAAMREPTKAMLDASLRPNESSGADGTWLSMIGAALEERK